MSTFGNFIGKQLFYMAIFPKIIPTDKVKSIY